MTLSTRAQQAEPEEARTCANCVHVHTFKPRPDEEARYGFNGTGWGCRKLNYEGYTQPFSTCNFFAKATGQ